MTEIVVFVGLVLLVAGFFVSPPRGPLMIGAGLVLGSLAGLELAAREHFAGYRSHSMVLAGAVGLVAMVGIWFLGSEVVSIPVIVTRRTYAIAALIVILTALVSVLVVRRRLDRIDIVTALKHKE